MGSVLSSILSGLLCEHGFDGGWPSIFYVFGEEKNYCSDKLIKRTSVLYGQKNKPVKNLSTNI